MIKSKHTRSFCRRYVSIGPGILTVNLCIIFSQDDTYVPSFQTFEKPTKTLREIELMSAHKTRENNSILRIGKKITTSLKRKLYNKQRNYLAMWWHSIACTNTFL